MIRKFLFGGLTCLASSGCFSAETFHIDHGQVQVFSSEIGTHPTFLTKLFNSKLCIVDDQHPELAQALLDEITAAGHQVTSSQEKSQLYTIEEVYAGKPDDYAFPQEHETSGLQFPIFHLLGNGLVCMALKICNSPAIASNATFDTVNNAQAEAIHDTSPKLPESQKKPTLMEISKLCTMQGRSCALSAALAYAPAVNLDQLRLANAREGFSRSMLLK
ncbi:hypothetical protein HA051_15190 [Chromobacterium vaccinii]|nr:hypothetical protein [Chromobacterium vaccinii]